MPKVFLVTKLNTTNIGNQALSNEIINVFKNEFGDENIHVGGRPVGLLNYDFPKIKVSEDPVALFESWAEKVYKKYISSDKKEKFIPSVPQIKLVTEESSEMKTEGVKKLLRPLKKKLSKVFVYDKSYRNRLNIIAASDVIVYSGAGEVVDTNVFLRQLLELRVAQKLGVKTAAVNQSVVISSDVYKKLLHHVYGKMDKIVVRGDVSKKLLESCGVDSRKISLAPDTAILSAEEKKEKKISSKVGLNFTPGIKYSADLVEPIINKLNMLGQEIYFITNEPIGDLNIQKELMEKYSLKSFGLIKSYKNYSEDLSGLKYIISARLHTNIIALSAQTPVIAIEGNKFKTSELMQQLNYPVPVINAYEDGWVGKVLNEIDKIENSEYDFKSYFEKVLPQLKLAVRKNAGEIKGIF